jgi:hypothetical protein
MYTSSSARSVESDDDSRSKAQSKDEHKSTLSCHDRYIGSRSRSGSVPLVANGSMSMMASTNRNCEGNVQVLSLRHDGQSESLLIGLRFISRGAASCNLAQQNYGGFSPTAFEN